MNATQVAPKAYDMNKNPDTDNIRTGHRTVKANDLKKIGEQQHQRKHKTKRPTKKLPTDTME